ncbi:MAG: hypothetical protein ACTSU4_13870 [Promethearchaeota archaeon]
MKLKKYRVNRTCLKEKNMEKECARVEDVIPIEVSSDDMDSISAADVFMKLERTWDLKDMNNIMSKYD